LCINVYIHGALWDCEIDDVSTVKIIGKPMSWTCLILTVVLFCIMLDSKMMVSKMAMIILNLAFLYFMKNKKWNSYTYVLILFGLVFFADILVHF
jgi:hypothetical protein